MEKKFPDLFILDDISLKVIVDGQISSIESVNKELDGLESASESEKVKQFRSSLREATTYMTRFRADSIVKDAEAIKEALMIPLDDDDAVEVRSFFLVVCVFECLFSMTSWCLHCFTISRLHRDLGEQR